MTFAEIYMALRKDFIDYIIRSHTPPSEEEKLKWMAEIFDESNIKKEGD